MLLFGTVLSLGQFLLLIFEFAFELVGQLQVVRVLHDWPLRDFPVREYPNDRPNIAMHHT